MGSAVAAAIALALALPAAAAETAPPASSSGSASCRGPARMLDFGSDGRIGANWNAASRTIAFSRAQKDGHYRPSSPTARQAAPHVHERARPCAVGEPLPPCRLALVRQDTVFFGDVMTQSLGLVGEIVRVDCG